MREVRPRQVRQARGDAESRGASFADAGSFFTESDLSFFGDSLIMGDSAQDRDKPGSNRDLQNGRDDSSTKSFHKTLGAKGGLGPD